MKVDKKMEAWEKIYNISFPENKEYEKLYFEGGTYIPGNGVKIKSGDALDLGTYFNGFSLLKWTRYTTLQKISIRVNLSGNANIEIYAIREEVEELLHMEHAERIFEKELDIQNLKAKDVELIGIKIHAEYDDVNLIDGGYWGVFTSTYPVKMGINICTFKREKYVAHNLEVLKRLINENKNFNVTIVDNGKTLSGIKGNNIQAFSNLNFGGAGGFTRGMMEQVNQGVNTHILMMDDDIVIEPSALERVYKVYQHIKEERRMQMFGGAMLSLANPTEQVENTAYWKKIRLISNGSGFDLTDKRKLYANEHFKNRVNSYAAWWFCCIPVEVVKENGYPLPVFIKGDDMEYGIRNRREIMSMNGIGVWHEPFVNKVSPVINYFSDRNMLIINHYADGCNRMTLMIAIFGRLMRRVMRLDSVGIRYFELALKDYRSGFEGITSVGADEKFELIKNFNDKNHILRVIGLVIKLGIGAVINYSSMHKKYLQFRVDKLQNQIFWRQYLRLG